MTDVCRQGEIQWRGGDDGPILVENFLTGQRQEVRPDLTAPSARTRGHGGADFFLVNSFTKAVARQVKNKRFQDFDCKNISIFRLQKYFTQDPSLIRSGPAASLASHMMVFRAEEGRRENKVVTL